MGFNFSSDVNNLTLETAVKVLIQYGFGITGGSGGGPSGGGGVVGIQESRTYQSALTAGSTVIPAGKLAVTVLFSSDFTGGIGGITISGADTVVYTDQSKPGNTLPAITVTRTAGNYSIITAGA